MAYGRPLPAIQIIATGGIMASLSKLVSADMKSLEVFGRVAYLQIFWWRIQENTTVEMVWTENVTQYTP